MAKKIFLSKNSRRGGGRSYLKIILWSTLALVVLVLLIPLSTRKQTGPSTPPKPASEKGMVVKEIPKAPAASPEAEKKPEGIPGFVPFDKSPEAGVPQEGKVASSTQPAGKPAAQSERSSDMNLSAMKQEASAEIPHKSAGEKAGPPGALVSQPLKEGKTATVKDGVAPAGKAADSGGKPEDQASARTESKKKLAAVKTTAPKAPKPPAEGERPAVDASPASEGQKPSANGGRTVYVVQVGSFKDKVNADEMQRNLQKKGYTVEVKNRIDPKLGPLFVVQLAPVEAMSKAHTLVEQIRREDKVKPFVMKVPAGE